ncbi:MAG: 2-oxo-4-hydroxy-4-carboxy-5-ureidoimidazoline decarboxylase [Thiotrichales bacterium]
MSAEKTRFDISPATLSEKDFMERFGGIYEHSPWVAAAVYQAGIDSSFDEIDTLASTMRSVVDAAEKDKLSELIRAHPDLAGKAALKGELTEESSSEQASAGLDQCSAEELQRFTELNDAYKARFGFPFIMAVRFSDRYAILDAFEERLANTPEREFARAIQEIHKIALFRLQEL